MRFFRVAAYSLARFLRATRALRRGAGRTAGVPRFARAENGVKKAGASHLFSFSSHLATTASISRSALLSPASLSRFLIAAWAVWRRFVCGTGIHARGFRGRRCARRAHIMPPAVDWRDITSITRKGTPPGVGQSRHVNPPLSQFCSLSLYLKLFFLCISLYLYVVPTHAWLHSCFVLAHVLAATILLCVLLLPVWHACCDLLLAYLHASRHACAFSHGCILCFRHCWLLLPTGFGFLNTPLWWREGEDSCKYMADKLRWHSSLVLCDMNTSYFNPAPYTLPPSFFSFTSTSTIPLLPLPTPTPFHPPTLPCLPSDYSCCAF